LVKGESEAEEVKGVIWQSLLIFLMFKQASLSLKSGNCCNNFVEDNIA
jgi:hypothetical protein